MSNNNKTSNQLSQSSKYPQLPAYINQTVVSSLCITCTKTPNECCWLDSLKPVPNWEAEESHPEPNIKTYRVCSCPNFKLVSDYYSSEGDLMRLLSEYTGYKVSLIRRHQEEFLKAFEEYSIENSRSNTQITYEERKERYNKILNKYYKHKGPKV